MSRKGILISFEGGEGAGKTTQIKFLKEYLTDQGYDVVTTREPGGVEEAEALRDAFVKNQGQNWDVRAQALWAFTCRRLLLTKLIKPAMDKGQIVISDRFTDSTRVYQGVAGGLGIDEVNKIKEWAIGGFEPDLTFIFKIDPKIGLSRTSSRGEADNTFEDKALDFHQKLMDGYLDIANNDANRCVVVDAEKSVEQVSETIISEVSRYLKGLDNV